MDFDFIQRNYHFIKTFEQNFYSNVLFNSFDTFSHKIFWKFLGKTNKNIDNYSKLFSKTCVKFRTKLF